MGRRSPSLRGRTAASFRQLKCRFGRRPHPPHPPTPPCCAWQVVNRIRVSEPKPRAGGALRGTSIPASVVAARAAAAAGAAGGDGAAASGAGAGGSSTDLPDASARPTRKTQKDLQEEMGGAGVYSLPLQHHWGLKQPEWVNDIIPEIMDGKNILDFVDPEIEERLAELEAEEDQRAQLAALQADGDEGDDMDDDTAEAQRAVSALAKSIRKKKGLIKEKARMAKKNNHPTMSRAVAARSHSVAEFVQHMGTMGVATSARALSNLGKAAKAKGGFDALPARERRRDASADAPTERRGRSLTRGDDSMDVEGVESANVGEKRKLRASQVPRDRSSTARDSAKLAQARSPSAQGLRDEAAVKKAEKINKKKQKMITIMGRATESDRRIPCKRPKHLFSGKRGNGKTDRR